jgi:hypothetical protein
VEEEEEEELCREKRTSGHPSDPFRRGGGGAMRHAMPVLSKAARRISLASKANKGHHFLILFDCFVQWITRQNPSLDPTSLSTIRFAFESEA